MTQIAPDLRATASRLVDEAYEYRAITGEKYKQALAAGDIKAGILFQRLVAADQNYLAMVEMESKLFFEGKR